jgi:mRNA interferase MazF
LTHGGHGGLSEDSVAVCHQITTLDRSKLTRRIGALPPPALRVVEDGLRAAVDLASAPESH